MGAKSRLGRKPKDLAWKSFRNAPSTLTEVIHLSGYGVNRDFNLECSSASSDWAMIVLIWNIVVLNQ
jgi:hypothetical protein